MNEHVEIGSRIVLKNTDDEYTNLDRGDKGVIVGFGETPTNEKQIHVKWDNGSSLSLLMGIDEFNVIGSVEKMKQEELDKKCKNCGGTVIEERHKDGTTIRFCSDCGEI